MSNGFVIKHSEMYDLFWKYTPNLQEVLGKLSTLSSALFEFANDASFKGQSADAIKVYLAEVHLPMVAGFYTAAQSLMDNMLQYKESYRQVDDSTAFVLDEEAMTSYKQRLESQYNNMLDNKESIESQISAISDIMSIGIPDTSDLENHHEHIGSEIDSLKTNVYSAEDTAKRKLESSAGDLIDLLKQNLEYIGVNYTDTGQYTSGSFISRANEIGNKVLEINTIHADSLNALSDIMQKEENERAEAEERKSESIVGYVTAASLLIVGGMCILASFGAATPLVATFAGVAIGTGTIGFGINEAVEASDNMYYGHVGDIDTEAQNPLRDGVFFGNQEVYETTRNVFAFSAGAMIPVCNAASATGQVTLKSVVWETSKVAAADFVGDNVSQITFEQTNNEAVAISSGIIASGLMSNKLGTYDEYLYNSGKLGKLNLNNGNSILNGDDVKGGRNTATTIDYSYKFDRELANFNDGYEIRTTVDKDLILVQYSSDAPDASLCYWTTVDEANGITTLNDYMDKLALSKDWGNRNTVKVARIPAGTEVKYAVGTAREQLLIADPRPGGGVQYLFNQFDTDWITEIRSFSN